MKDGAFKSLHGLFQQYRPIADIQLLWLMGLGGQTQPYRRVPLKPSRRRQHHLIGLAFQMMWAADRITLSFRVVQHHCDKRLRPDALAIASVDLRHRG